MSCSPSPPAADAIHPHLRSGSVTALIFVSATTKWRGRPQEWSRRRKSDGSADGAVRGLDRRRKLRVAHQPAVYGRRTRTTLGDRPDDQRLAAPHVATDEHPRLRRRPVVTACDVGPLVE